MQPVLDMQAGSTRRFLEFRYYSPWGHDFTSMGYTFSEPGAYALVGQARLGGLLMGFEANYRLNPSEQRR